MRLQSGWKTFHKYIAEDNPEAAGRVVEGIYTLASSRNHLDICHRKFCITRSRVITLRPLDGYCYKF